MHQKLKAKLWPATAGIAVFAATFIVTYSHAVSLPYLSHETAALETGIAVPMAGSAPEVVFVYIGAAGCGPSNVPQLPRIVRTVRDAAAKQARTAGAGFRTIGIAKDPDARAGLEHLKKYGSFDEVSAGGGWLNLGTLKYIFSDLSGVGATPQVAVVLRTVQREGGVVGVRDERILARKVGVNELSDWANRGSDLPGLDALVH
jgi:hypothetical protein